MGDWAEMTLNGDLDEVTGEYIGQGDGFPRSIHTNWNGRKYKPYDNNGKEPSLRSKTESMKSFMLRKGCTNDNWSITLAEYMESIGQPLRKAGKMVAFLHLEPKNFQKFATWLDRKQKGKIK